MKAALQEKDGPSPKEEEKANGAGEISNPAGNPSSGFVASPSRKSMLLSEEYPDSEHSSDEEAPKDAEEQKQEATEDGTSKEEAPEPTAAENEEIQKREDGTVKL